MSESNGPKRIGAVPKEISLEIEERDEQNNVVVNAYMMRELMGNMRDMFLNIVTKKIILDDQDRPTKGSDFTGSCSDLLSKCMYTAQGALVPEKRIQTWSNTAQQELVKMAVELSGLGKGALEEAAKNS